MSEEKTEKIEVEITKNEDEKAKIKDLEKQLEDEKTLKEQAEEKLDLVAQKEFEKKKRELGAPSEIDTVEKLQGYEQALKGKSQATGGTAPLSGQNQYSTGDSFTKKQFNSPKAMCEELKLRMHDPNPEVRAEAKSIYEILLQKAIRAGGTGQSEGVGLAELVRKPKKEND